MKISRNKLKVLIEQYVFEQEESEESPENSPAEEEPEVEKSLEDKLKSFETVEFEIKEVRVNISENDGGLCLTVSVPGREDEVYPKGSGILKPEDIEEKSTSYIDFVVKVSQLIAGLSRENSEEADSNYEKLVGVLGVFDDAVNHPQSKIAFDKHYVLRKPMLS